MFDSGLSYNYLNTARIALSAVGNVLHEFVAGNHPVIIRFMKGVLNQRPATSRYSQYWDVAVVLPEVVTSKKK